MDSKKAIKIWTAALIKECAGKTAVEQKKIILRLKEILKVQKRDYLLKKIVGNTLAQMKKQAKFEIILAREQSAEVVANLEKILAKQLDIGEDADVAIDPSIIGGFVAITDKYLIDASAKGYLEQLEKLYQN